MSKKLFQIGMLRSNFELTARRWRMMSLVSREENMLNEQHQPDGYNIGVKCGEAAGQTVFHVHVHLIPRYEGDLEDPRGGVRGVIPEKRMY